MNTVVPVLKALESFQRQETMLSQFGRRGPFQILISTILSARTKDTTTIPICGKLFTKYSSAEQLAKAKASDVQRIIYGVGFYKTKAPRIVATAKILCEKYGGQVPDSLEKLLELPGVGRKTANCVLVYAFRKPSIPVDTHVHRISNRLGWVKTKTPEKTELALQKIVPKKYWAEVNEHLVTHGQTICVPISPFCSKCPVYKYCGCVGVKVSR